MRLQLMYLCLLGIDSLQGDYKTTHVSNDTNSVPIRPEVWGIAEVSGADFRISAGSDPAGRALFRPITSEGSVEGYVGGSSAVGDTDGATEAMAEDGSMRRGFVTMVLPVEMTVFWPETMAARKKPATATYMLRFSTFISLSSIKRKLCEPLHLSKPHVDYNNSNIEPPFVGCRWRRRHRHRHGNVDWIMLLIVVRRLFRFQISLCDLAVKSELCLKWKYAWNRKSRSSHSMCKGHFDNIHFDFVTFPHLNK
jgi:hypothetical protein